MILKITFLNKYYKIDKYAKLRQSVRCLFYCHINYIICRFTYTCCSLYKNIIVFYVMFLIFRFFTRKLLLLIHIQNLNC